MGWRPEPLTKKYKTFHPYRIAPTSSLQLVGGDV